MADYYQIICGRISELKVTDTDARLFKSNKLAGLPALGFLALGDSAAAASQVGLADDNQDDVDYLNSCQYFSCKVGKLTVVGLVSRAFFNNGDNVEVVVEPLDDGSYFAYALRRPIDHRLWLHPNSMQGTDIGKKEAFRQGLFIFILGIVFYTIFSFWLLFDTGDFIYFIWSYPLYIFLIFLFSLCIYFCMKKGLNTGSKIANKIFATLGYPHPERVDMDQEFIEFYFSDKSENDPDFYVDITTKEYNQYVDGMKWVTFYREAPPIPEYIKVIRTEDYDE